MKICEILYQDKYLVKGLETKQIAAYMAEKDEECRDLLFFLQKIGVLEIYQQQIAKGVSSVSTWRLTPTMKELYGKVMKK